jgi:Tfp pilus assembly protein PilP
MKRPRMPHILFLAGILFVVPGLPGAKTPEKVAAGKSPKQLEAPIPFGSIRYNSGGRRDPFLNPLALKKKEIVDEEEPRDQPPPGTAGMEIARVRLLGMVTANGLPTAVVQGTDQRVYFVKEGDRLFDGFIKKVGTDSVLLIRETKMRSGKIVTQEVTKRLRTP